MPEEAQGVDLTPDDILVASAREGSKLAQEELFRRHFAISHRVAARLLGREEDALDAVQEGFLKALRHLGKFDGRSEFRTWLLRIVTNAALDLGRQRQRRHMIRLDDPEHAHSLEPSVNGDPGHRMHREDLRRVLAAALDRLSPAIRTTFVLFAEAGLSYKEIAASQGVPVGTVMSRIHFARQKLQSWLEPQLEPVDEPRSTVLTRGGLPLPGVSS
jgi:RNA polymerase sigma-70 factor (ECF subfamily)